MWRSQCTLLNHLKAKAALQEALQVLMRCLLQVEEQVPFCDGVIQEEATEAYESNSMQYSPADKSVAHPPRLLSVHSYHQPSPQMSIHLDRLHKQRQGPLPCLGAWNVDLSTKFSMGNTLRGLGQISRLFIPEFASFSFIRPRWAVKEMFGRFCWL